MIKALKLSFTSEECIGKRVIIELDSSNVINWMIKESNKSWKFHVLLIFASRFFSGLRWVIKYSDVLRKDNSMAYALAKQGVTRNYELMTWF